MTAYDPKRTLVSAPKLILQKFGLNNHKIRYEYKI